MLDGMAEMVGMALHADRQRQIVTAARLAEAEQAAKGKQPGRQRGSRDVIAQVLVTFAARLAPAAPTAYRR
jgi:hypothetical protein